MKKKTVVLISVITAVVLLIAGAGIFWYFDSGVRPLTARREKKIIEAFADPSDAAQTAEEYEIETYFGSYMGADVFTIRGHVPVDQSMYTYVVRGYEFQYHQSIPYIFVFKNGKLYSFELFGTVGYKHVNHWLQKRHVAKIYEIYYEKYEKPYHEEFGED